MSRKTRQDIVTLPARGSSGAPSRFRGDREALRSFLREVQDLLDSHDVDDKDVHAEALFHYCGSSVRKLLKDLPCYRQRDPKAMIKALKTIYPRQQASEYRRSDLRKLAEEYANGDSKLETINDFLRYKTRFDRIGYRLLEDGKIGRLQFDELFWLVGIAKDVFNLAWSLREGIAERSRRRRFKP
ncbi:unnamed protein product [Tilletia controversa]|nr:unnamed protein product [Tilletia controversa]CAD6947091.1 unnamed protein product [Tilletia controversa]CAD6985658.1 unnamed protein product [Tilletia controversa]